MKVTYTVFDGEIISETRGTEHRTYIPDANGNTVALIDENSEITDTFSYWPFGELSSRTGTTPTPLQFGGSYGYYSSVENTLSYVRRRFFEAATGQWITVDPLWPAEAPYSYVASNPTTFFDLYGEQLFQRSPAFGPDPTYPVKRWMAGFNRAWGSKPRLPLPYTAFQEPVEKALPPPCGCFWVELWVKSGLQFLVPLKHPLLDAMAAAGALDKRQGTTGKGRRDALNHCVTACELMRNAPECVGYWQGREFRRYFGHTESMMDHWNNSIGFAVAKLPGSCVDNCLRAIPHLTWFSPTPHNWPL